MNGRSPRHTMEYSVAEIADSARTAAPDAGTNTGVRQQRSVRIDLRRLDNLMNLIGELVITRGRLVQIAGLTGDSELIETVAQAWLELLHDRGVDVFLANAGTDFASGVPFHCVSDRPQHLRRGAHRGIDVVRGVRGGDEPRFELRRCEVDAFGQHAVEEPRELRAVAPHRVG